MPQKYYFSSGKIKEFPTRVYIDTSALLAAYWENSTFFTNAKNLLLALSFAHSEVYISPLCFVEAWWVIIKKVFSEKIKSKHKSEKLCEDYLKEDRKFFRQYQRYLREFKEKHTDRWTKAKLFKMIDVPSDVIEIAYDTIKNTPMIPTDALHYAIAVKHEVNAIVTGDDDFDYIPDPNFVIFSILPEKRETL